MRYPAIFRTSSGMPKKCSTKRPKKRNVTRITNTHTPVFKAVRPRSFAVHDEVIEKKMGIPPKGSTIGKSARNVAAAECGSVRRNCPRACVASILSVGFEWVKDLYPKMLKGLFVPSGYAEPIEACSGRNHSVVEKVVLLANLNTTCFAETAAIHWQAGR